MSTKEFRTNVLNVLGDSEEGNTSTLAWRERVLRSLGVDFTDDDLTITLKWREKVLDGLSEGYHGGSDINLDTAEVTPTKQLQRVVPGEGYDGLSEVLVNPIPNNYIIPSGSVNISQNGTVDVTNYASAAVNVSATIPPNTMAKGVAERTQTQIIVEDGATKIGEGAFYRFFVLQSVILPNTITSIGNTAFYQCENLELTSLPNGITSIGTFAFYMCKKIALTSLPSGITSIERQSFYQCENLELTSLPNGITSIGEQAFRKCIKIVQISLPNTITSIGDFAFAECTSLSSFTFNRKPNSIGQHTFDVCNNLTDIYVPWSQGEVANAPWGATNATIHYNWTGE